MAEFAIIVHSALKGKELGHLLLQKIIRYCQSFGIKNWRVRFSMTINGCSPWLKILVLKSNLSRKRGQLRFGLTYSDNKVGRSSASGRIGRVTGGFSPQCLPLPHFELKLQAPKIPCLPCLSRADIMVFPHMSYSLSRMGEAQR